jgi:NOL1/NOP2/fmu family ribosome biogenesis protein
MTAFQEEASKWVGGQDVKEGQDGVEEADFLVRNQAQGQGQDDARP